MGEQPQPAQGNAPAIGDEVIVQAEERNRGKWPLDIVENVIVGTDGMVCIVVLWLGLWKDRQDTFNFNYPQNPICALGVFFSYNMPEADILNLDEKLRKMEKGFEYLETQKTYSYRKD